MEAAQSSGYEGRIGRYGETLADAFIAVVGVRSHDLVLDVGCGTGALTARLASVVGAEHVCAVDPDAADVGVCRARVPGAHVEIGRAEELPYRDRQFDAALAQLVVSHMDDANKGVAEMRRVTRRSGVVAICVWDFAGGMTVLRTFWDAAKAVSAATAERFDQASTHRYRTRADLEELLESAQLREVESGGINASAEYIDFDDLWNPLAIPDGTPGRFLEAVGRRDREAIRDELRTRLGSPSGPFQLSARAWYARGYA